MDQRFGIILTDAVPADRSADEESSVFFVHRADVAALRTGLLLLWSDQVVGGSPKITSDLRLQVTRLGTVTSRR